MPHVARVDHGADFERDRTAFEVAPIAIWQEDFSGVEELCMELEALGVEDLRERLEAERDLLESAIRRIRVIDVNQAAVDLVGASGKQDLLGPLPAELLAETALASFTEQVIAVWEQRPRLQLELAGVNFAGSRMDCTLHWAAPVNDDVPDYSQVIVMIRDVTASVQAEAQMRRHAEQLAVLLELGRQITSTFDLDTILQRIVDATVELLGVDESLILLFDPITDEVTHALGKSHPTDAQAAHELSELLGGISRWVAREKKSTLSQDIATDRRNTAAAADRASAIPGTSVAVAPIMNEGAVIGALTALNHRASEGLTGEHLSVIDALAGQAAVAIENARLYDEIHSAHRELQDAQAKLLQAQKLEAIGSLAAGIAHEINTPIQYVADNTRFVMEGAGAAVQISDAVKHLLAVIEEEGDPTQAAEALAGLWESEDYDFLVAEMPGALDQTLEGVERVASIVRAMKEFAHPGTEGKAATDLNRSLRTTGDVSRNEWKYVADLEFDLDDSLPPVPVLSGPLNQAFLILIVNAAQAIEEHLEASAGERGRITVTSRVDGAWVEIRVSDNGPGIPPHILERIYDPFFTTKEVGKGSGQGLSIARSVITEQHGGSLDYEPGNPGATFVIRLPIGVTGEAAA